MLLDVFARTLEHSILLVFLPGFVVLVAVEARFTMVITSLVLSSDLVIHLGAGEDLTGPFLLISSDVSHLQLAVSGLEGSGIVANHIGLSKGSLVALSDMWLIVSLGILHSFAAFFVAEDVRILVGLAYGARLDSMELITSCRVVHKSAFALIPSLFRGGSGVKVISDPGGRSVAKIPRALERIALANLFLMPCVVCGDPVMARHGHALLVVHLSCLCHI